MFFINLVLPKKRQDPLNTFSSSSGILPLLVSFSTLFHNTNLTVSPISDAISSHLVLPVTSKITDSKAPTHLRYSPHILDPNPTQRTQIHLVFIVLLSFTFMTSCLNATCYVFPPRLRVDSKFSQYIVFCKKGIEEDSNQSGDTQNQRSWNFLEFLRRLLCLVAWVW